MSDNNSGTVIDLFISNKDRGRENKNEIELAIEGIYEDKFFSKEVNRSILITSNESYLIAKENGIDAPFGSLGENILVSINPYGLKSGDKISIGETVVEITQNCTICNSLAKVNPNLPKILKSDRGIFAKTIKSGKIRKGDSVNILKY